MASTFPTHRQLVLLARAAFVIYFALVLYVCFGKFDSLPSVVNETLWGIEGDKIIHFIMFFPYPILLFMVRRRPFTARRQVWRYALLILVTGLVIGAATEIGQSFTPYRDNDPYDLFADGAALLSSTLLCLPFVFYVLSRRLRRQNEHPETPLP